MKIAKKQIAFNCTKRTDRIMYIVVHDTGNPANGANAESHYKYFNGGNRGSSADIFVDDTQALQVNDYTTYYSWHCGDGRGKYGITNNNSVGVEMCINSDGDYNKAFENTARVVRQLMSELNIPIERVVRHYDASRKNCPQTFSSDGWARWNEFKKRLTEDIDMEELKKLAAKVAELEQKFDWMDDNMPEWARPTVQKLMDKGALVGDDEGRLGLTYDTLKVLVVLDRQGVFG